MIVIIAQFDVPPGSRDRMIEIAREMDEKSNAEPGCLHYRNSIDISNPNRFVLTEMWADADALYEHFASPHFRAFFAAASELGAVPNLKQFDAEEIAATDERFWLTLIQKAQSS